MMDPITAMSTRNASSLYQRAATACPESPNWDSTWTDQAAIITEIQQPIVDVFFQCIKEDDDSYHWNIHWDFSDKSDEREKAACWFYYEIKGTCEDSKAWHCVDEKGKNKGKKFCKNKSSEKGAAGKIGVSKMRMGVVGTLVITSIIGMF